MYLTYFVLSMGNLYSNGNEFKRYHPQRHPKHCRPVGYTVSISRIAIGPASSYIVFVVFLPFK